MKHSQTLTDRTLYVHRRKDNNEVFYVGCGNTYRPYNKHNRNKDWNFIADNYGWYPEIIQTGLSKDVAGNNEAALIEHYGLDNLTNMKSGGYWGYTISDEHKEAIRNAHLGRVMSQESKDKISKAKMKPVEQYTLDGKFVTFFPSVKEAQEFLGTTGIYNMLAGQARTAAGYIWKLSEMEVE